MITAINSVGSLGSSEAVGKEENLETHETKTWEIPAVKDGGELISFSKPAYSNSIEASEASKSGQSIIKGRGVLLPLLDLHKDHDLDSLPSPTREAPSCFPVKKSLSVGEGMDKSGLPLAGKTGCGKMELDGEGSKFHLYETDALRAVSTYQQKFGRSSFFTNDELPSPTPSGDCEEGVVDTNDEVSSASIAASLTSSKPTLLDQIPVSSSSVDKSSVHGLVNSRIDAAGSGSYAGKTSAKSRDPRLRFINSEASTIDLNQPSGTHNMPKVEYGGTITSRKHKTVEEPSLDATVTKKPRRSLENTEHNMREARTVAGNGGWLEDTTLAGSQQLIERNHLMQKGETELNTTFSTSSGNLNVTSNGNEQAPVTSSTTASLPDLLKGIAVNPTMLLNILMEQQRLAAEAKKNSADSASSTSTLHLRSSNSAKGADTTVNIGPAMTAGLPQNSVGMPPVSSQAASMVKSFYENIFDLSMHIRSQILHYSLVYEVSSSYYLYNFLSCIRVTVFLSF